MQQVLGQTIIVDNSPASYLFQPENALACDTFIDDLADRPLAVELLLERVARVFFLRTHVNISAADAAVLSQRLGRAAQQLF